MTVLIDDPKYRRTPFGELLEYDLPAGCDAVILCSWNMQIRPEKLLLPGQIYRKDIESLSKNGKPVYLIPIRSEQYIEVNPAPRNRR